MQSCKWDVHSFHIVPYRHVLKSLPNLITKRNHDHPDQPLVSPLSAVKLWADFTKCLSCWKSSMLHDVHSSAISALRNCDSLLKSFIPSWVNLQSKIEKKFNTYIKEINQQIICNSITRYYHNGKLTNNNNRLHYFHDCALQFLFYSRLLCLLQMEV